ncbi:hypothetical protein [Kineococcus auxinigenes]
MVVVGEDVDVSANRCTFRQTAEITERGTPPGWNVEVAVDEVLLR